MERRPTSISIGQKWACPCENGDMFTVVSHNTLGWRVMWDDGIPGYWANDAEILNDPQCTFLGWDTDKQSNEVPPLGERAAQWLEGIATMLREKNKAYGNSLGDPVRIFTDIDPIKLTLARAEDKLSRIARGQAGGEDVPKDLVGYIALAVALGWNGEKLR